MSSQDAKVIANCLNLLKLDSTIVNYTCSMNVKTDVFTGALSVQHVHDHVVQKHWG